MFVILTIFLDFISNVILGLSTMRNPITLDPIRISPSTSSSFSNSSLKNHDVHNNSNSSFNQRTNGLKSKKNSSKLLSSTSTSQSNSSGSSQAPILKPRSVSSNESQSNPDEKDSNNSTTCWFKEASKTSEYRSNLFESNSNFRKSFLRKQSLLRKSGRLIGDELANFVRDTKLKGPLESTKKAKSSFVNLINGTSNVNTNNTYHKTNSLKYTSHKEREERETATTTIILDLEKYNINEKSSKSSGSAKKIMVNIPLTPKKHHTFNENDSPSHKESLNTLVINSQIPINNQKQANGDNNVIFLNKPIAKNNSTVNPNSIKSKPIIRRPPKEFLSATITQKEPLISGSRNGSVERNSADDEINNHRTTSPITKSLPSYDEALKRVSSEARAVSSHRKITNFNKSSPTSFNQNPPLLPSNNQTTDQNVASTIIQQQQNYSGFNSFLKSRTALPNLPLQSTFKSLLSTPVNQNGQNAQKVYFRPQDLQNRPSQNGSDKSTSSPLSTHSNGLLIPPAPTPPARRISAKNLYQTTSPDLDEIKTTSIVQPVIQRTPSPKIEKINTEFTQNKMRSWASQDERVKSPEKNMTTWKSTIVNNEITPTTTTTTQSPKPKENTTQENKFNFSIQAPSSNNVQSELNKIDETITGSFLETISDSSITQTTEMNKKKDSIRLNGLNDARIKLSSDSTSTNNNNNQFKNSNLKSNFRRNLNMKLNRQVSSSSNNDFERPPGRLNNYDSDTNTISEGIMITSNLIKRSNSEYLHKKPKSEEFSDAPDLSDITEGKFDDLEIPGKGHRTSTPNMSKRRRSTSLSSTDIKQIKKQLEELEKMYFELLRIIDPEKQSSYSDDRISSSTSLSSFSSSYTDLKTPNSNKNTNRKERNDLNQMKHRFSRMESHMTSLAKTVAQISLELKSVKTIEEVIYNLTREIQELKKLNMHKITRENENSLFDKLNDLQRSTSEPNIINSIINSELNNLKHNESKLNYSKYAKSTYCLTDNKKLDTNDKYRSLAPSYSNPKKLKKLTKFFGQEPPMLRLFLQKLNYEMYAPNFEHEHITITELPYLSEERLKSLGIPLGPRLRIMKEAQLSFRLDNLNNNFV
ncbi:unnamed protein product [Brachionus calyciflorus]|uniref:SAM domain-containing protein n=1 Tax=Brachionus calyciflorus TaxID=104777 RepID=A0A814ANJ2_9BILA|nr:unnamed protein product [Brachionus calyciflorus]